MVLLTLVFGIAVLYSSVGLGGGSAYTALLAIFGVTYTVIPGISLTLNLIVTLSGAFNYIRKGHARYTLILPFIFTSVPMAYVGGKLHLSADLFYLLLLVSLTLVAIRFYALQNIKMNISLTHNWQFIISLIIGGLLGFIAGAVGIGGGVFLVPLILILGMGNEKEAAASGSVFILINSLAGISGRFHAGFFQFDSTIIFLALAVLLGGFLGSYFGAVKFKPVLSRHVLGIVIVIAIFLLGKKIIL